MNYYSIKCTNRLRRQSVLLIGAMLMISVSSASSQVAFFTNADCGVDVSITANCPTMTWISVPVSGVGNLGSDNYGIDGVGVVLSQSAGFACNIYLRAPNDSIYLLASGEEGFNSFPNYSNGPLNIEFKGCANLPYSSANVAQPSGKSFQPFDDFTELNELGINPNGDWEIGFCGLPDDITVSCVNLTFNLICPEVVAVNVTDASCSGIDDGTIELITDGGSCFPTYFSLNNGPVVTTSHWEDLSPGAYNIHITNYLSAERSSALSICEQDVQVNISVNDLTRPSITCPPDLTVYIPDNAANDTCQWVAPLTFEVPTFSDNCGIVSAQFDYYLDDIFYGTQNRNPGESGAKYENYVYQYGINRFVYRVSDGNQTSECTYFITVVDTIAPIWWPPTADTVLTFECDGTNYNIPDSLQYWAYDHRLCGNDFTKFTLIDHQTICGYAYEDLYEVTLYDPSGNENPEKRHVIVRLQDTHPPVLSGVPSGSAIAYCGSGIEGLPEIGNQITAYDSCLGDVTDRIQESISSTVFGCELPDTIGIYEQITYTYSVADDCGHETVQSFVVNVLDTTAPVFTGMLPDVTITCEQTMPALPVITAFDSCYGDVSDRITIASSIQSGNCTTGSIAQIVQYSWAVTDPCGNAAHYDWTVTVMNNLNVNLGSDRVLCIGDTAYLNAGNEGSSYFWSTGATTQQIAVKNAGTYIVTVTSTNGCCATDTIDVVVNPLPVVTASGGTLSCNQLSVTLIGTSSIAGSSFLWNGPQGFTSGNPSEAVTVPGIYQLTITSPLGCAVQTTIEVPIDTVSPAFELRDDTLTCSKDSLRLFVSPVVSDYTYAWSGPDNFHSGELNPWTKTPGDYTLVVTAPNGCSTMALLTIVSDQTPPAFELHDDTLTCSKDSLRLFVSPAVSDYTYAWSGPDNFHSGELNPWTKTPGDYTLVVTAPNGCSTMALLTIVSDQTPPAFELHDDTLTCSKDSLRLFVSPAV
ncbi:MAG TPA: hypothetical protein PKY06_21250, partial [Saprospiraceae bacterium]|nr:hypothetical protein [Saprospiraceae bacterium]